MVNIQWRASETVTTLKLVHISLNHEGGKGYAGNAGARAQSIFIQPFHRELSKAEISSICVNN